MATTWIRDTVSRGGRRGVSVPGRSDLRAMASAFAGTRIVVQPIISVATGSVFAVEALARFSPESETPTDEVFTQAHEAGYGAALEEACVRAALARRADLPPGVLLSVNVSPDVVQGARFSQVWPDDLTGVIIEVTEQGAADPNAFMRGLATLRDRGAAVAIDDVSSGYAGLLRLAQLRPDYVKIDRQVVTGVGDSHTQAAVLESLVTLSHRLGAAVIGEGVEDLDDLQSLGEFDVDYGQGYAIALPSARCQPIAGEVVDACRAGRQRMLLRPAASGRAAARTRDVYAVTAALAAAGDRNDLSAAIANARAELKVDVIGVSIIAVDDTVREIAVTGTARDRNVYPLAEYPATVASMSAGRTLEVHTDDPTGDPAEREVLRAFGHASLLMVPIIVDDRPVGVLELMHRSMRRWSAHDIAYAQGLAAHLAPVLSRLGVALVR